MRLCETEVEMGIRVHLKICWGVTYDELTFHLGWGRGLEFPPAASCDVRRDELRRRVLHDALKRPAFFFSCLFYGGYENCTVSEAYIFLLFGRSNKTLYDEVSLIPLPADYQPTLEQLPVTGTDADKGKVTRSILGEI